tara:strand:+ start:236 stop:472 length:237 start_codon:yes stop_codon:yes gene_type:complete
MKTIIHVNQHVIKSNRKNNNSDPVLTCKTYNSNNYASKVAVYGQDGLLAGHFIYSANKPLSCGAHVWFETFNKIKIIN